MDDRGGIGCGEISIRKRQRSPAGSQASKFGGLVKAREESRIGPPHITDVHTVLSTTEPFGQAVGFKDKEPLW